MSYLKTYNEKMIPNGVINSDSLGNYIKPESGIPKSDLSEDVQETLNSVEQKQETLVSGENIKTINNESILGEGNIAITAQTYVIDNTPAADSDNLVKSGGVAREIVWDVTARNSNATFASLSALLSDANLATLIPTTIRRGGMQIRFVHSNDNKYVQYFLTKNEWSASESDWEKMNLEEEVSDLENAMNGITVEETDITSQFTMTNNTGMVADSTNANYGTRQSNSGWMASAFVDISAYAGKTLKMAFCKTKGAVQAKEGVCFYSTNNVANVLAGIQFPNSATDNIVEFYELSVVIDPTWKYLRTTYYVSLNATVPFYCSIVSNENKGTLQEQIDAIPEEIDTKVELATTFHTSQKVNETDIVNKAEFGNSGIITSDGVFSELYAETAESTVDSWAGEGFRKVSGLLIKKNRKYRIVASFGDVSNFYVAYFYGTSGQATYLYSNVPVDFTSDVNADKDLYCYISQNHLSLVPVTFTLMTIDNVEAKLNDAEAELTNHEARIEKLETAQFPSISMFEKVGFCGASFVAGALFDGGVLIGDVNDICFGKVMGRNNGFDAHIYAQGGSTIKLWLERANCLPKLLSEDPMDLYLLQFGAANEVTAGTTKGTIADINADYTQNPDTYYGNFGRAIDQIKAHAPNAKIVLVKTLSKYSGLGYDWCSEPIEEIADHYGIPYLETKDSPVLWSDWLVDNIEHTGNGAHPTAVGYAAIATGVKDLLERAMYDEWLYFNDYKPQSVL